MQPHFTSYTIRRFWSQVDKTEGCWVWKGSRFRTGYGRMHDRLVHRMSWIIHHGPIPDGLLVLHNCPGTHNRCCVNPAHLKLGTHKENAEDRDRQGTTARGDRSGPHRNPERMARGEDSGRCKLTESQVKEIRCRKAAGERCSELGREFGINRSHVSRIARRTLWKNV